MDFERYTILPPRRMDLIQWLSPLSRSYYLKKVIHLQQKNTDRRIRVWLSFCLEDMYLPLCGETIVISAKKVRDEIEILLWLHSKE